jgi:hypothetical protein
VFLKLMDRGGDFRVIEVADCSFRRHPEPVAHCDRGKPGEAIYPLAGNAFLLNAEGRTIDSFFIQADRKTGT